MFDFGEFQNVLLFCEFYKGTITWLIESSDEKKAIRFVVSKQNSGVNIVLNGDITRIIRFYYLKFD